MLVTLIFVFSEDSKWNDAISCKYEKITANNLLFAVEKLVETVSDQKSHRFENYL